MTHYAMFGAPHKFEDIFNFLTHRYLLRNLEHCIFKTEVTCIYNAIRIGNMANNTIRRIRMFQYNGINSVV